MILELTFNNYRLFKNANTLSFKADKRTRHLLSNSTPIDGVNVLKALAIYGSNNSGKTNIVSLFEMMKSILASDNNIVCNCGIFGDTGETSFSVVFDNKDGKGWLRYEGSYDSETKTFPYEKLSSLRYYNTSTRDKTIFERHLSEKRLTVLGEDRSSFLDVLPSDRPFLSTVEVNTGSFSNLKEWKDSLNRCADFIVPIRIYNIPISHTIDFLKSRDADKCSFIKSFVKAADVSVGDFDYFEDLSLDISEESINEGALSVIKGLADPFKLMTSYGNSKVPSLLYDSSGTKKIEAIASYIYDALVEGKLLVVDELDNGLHYSLTRAIVSLFNNIGNVRGQILFTAHDLLLIDSKNLLRKEQIYFVFREKNIANLTSLSSFKANAQHLREGSSLVKRYNHGDFGEVPSPSFVKDLISLLEKSRC